MLIGVWFFNLPSIQCNFNEYEYYSTSKWGYIMMEIYFEELQLYDIKFDRLYNLPQNLKMKSLDSIAVEIEGTVGNFPLFFMT